MTVTGGTLRIHAERREEDKTKGKGSWPGWIRGILRGSVSQHCVRHASVPALVVRDV